MSESLKLSVLQLWSAHKTVAMAPYLEEYGYRRLWLSEHHGEGAYSASPLLLAAVIAGVTQRMRTGPAGVLLQYHNPLQIAEDARMLELLYPGRIDLGIARATERDPVVAAALLDGREPGDVAAYERKIDDLRGFLGQIVPPPGEPERVAVPRGFRSRAEMWILGSSPNSAPIAARAGACFGFSRLINANDDETKRAIAAYRETFVPGPVVREPYVSLLVSGLCADSDTAARALLPAAARDGKVPQIAGGGATCRDLLLELRDRFALDELAFVDLSPTAEEKLRSYRRLAEACALTAEELVTAAPAPPSS